MAIADFNHIKDILDALDINKPSRFAYTQDALDATGSAEISALTGVYAVEDSSQINSIPEPEQVAMDSLVMSIGLRTQAATVSRMMINHFFGRLSLNMVKLTEKLNLLVNEHLVNRYITPSGDVMEDITAGYTADTITLVKHKSPLSASAPITSSSAISLLAAVYNGNAGMMSGADKKVLDDLDDYAVRTIGDQTISGTKTFNNSPSFNGGDGTYPPFFVDGNFKVTNLNADKIDDADLETVITDSDTKVPSSGAVIDYVNGRVPIGTILMYGKATAPTNYLICNGDDINRTTFSALFAVIGTAYGVGNGSTTFNLPNYNAVVPKGPGSQAINGRTKTGPTFSDLQEDQLQNVTGSIPIEGTEVTGAFSSSGVSVAGGSGTGIDIRTDFSFANAGARNGSYTRDSSLGTNFVIRYQ